MFFAQHRHISTLNSAGGRPGLPVFVGGITLLLAVVIFIALPIDLTYTIHTKGQVMPAQEWILALDNSGRLSATLHSHVHGTPEKYAFSQFDRQDAVQFTLAPGMVQRTYIEAGDTVGTIYSSETERKLSQLMGELQTEQAALAQSASGSKASVITEAEGQLQRAQAKVKEQQKIVERLRQLKSKGATSIQQMEIAEGNLGIYKYDVNIAQARLESVKTGAKDTRLGFIRARIAALHNEIETIKKRSDNFTLRSPISGATYKFAMSDTMLVVADVSSYVVMMPVAWSKRAYLKIGQRVHVYSHNKKDALEGTIIRMDNFVRTLGYQQVFMAVVLVEPAANTGFVPGMITNCEIETDQIRPLEYLRRLIKTTVGQFG